MWCIRKPDSQITQIKTATCSSGVIPTQNGGPGSDEWAVSTTKRAWASEIVAREMPIPDAGSVQPKQRQESRGGAQINSLRRERTTWESVLHVGLVLPSFDR